MPKKNPQPWWKLEPILDGPGQQEALAFKLRRGGGPEDLERQYEQAFTKAHAEELAKAGHTFIEVTFFKGLGLEYERSEWERSKRFLAWLREKGVRTGVYTQWGSFFTETFFREVPEARAWVQIGVNGKPIEYGDPPNQYFRWRGCPGNPDFVRFLRKAIDIAVKEIGVDVVYFDNVCLFEGHDTLCYCECCRRGLREYLDRKYPTPEALYARMGLRSAADVEPPPFRPWTDFTLVAEPIKDPLLQEFIEYRCEQLADAWHATYEYLQSVNPNVALMGNPSFPRKYNERLTSAIDMWRLKRTPALSYMENAVRDVGVREGVVVSNIRGYKYGRALGQIMVCCGGEAEPALSYCEGLAFQQGSGGKMTPAAWPYRKFFEAQQEHFYRDTEPLSEIAILRHDVSLTWRWHEAFTVMELAQQELLSAGLPWMPLWGQQLLDGTLEKFKVLVVPGCACLSKAEAAKILGFAASGGGVVLLENAGCFDEFHHTLKTWRFAPAFESVADPAGFALHYTGRLLTPHFEHQKKALSSAYGQGQIAYLPQIRSTREPVRTYEEIGGYDGFEHLKLPAAWRQLAKVVEGVAPGGAVAAKVAAPRTLMAEFLRKAGTQRIDIHLVNYASKKLPSGVRVILAEKNRRTARLYLPGASPDGKPLKPASGAGRGVVYQLPAFERYALVLIE